MPAKEQHLEIFGEDQQAQDLVVPCGCLAFVALVLVADFVDCPVVVDNTFFLFNFLFI